MMTPRLTPGQRSTSVVVLAALLVGSALATSLCDLHQCQCLSTSRGIDVFCKCQPRERVTIRSSELPYNVFNLTVEGCSSLGISGSLAPLPLRSLTIRGVKFLRLPIQAFLYGLPHLATVAIHDTNIPVIPAFSFGALESIVSMVFEKVEIGKISSDAFSNLAYIRDLKFVNSKIGDIERNAFGRGNGNIGYFILENSFIDTIRERGVWFQQADVAQIDGCRINKIVNSAIKLNNVLFYLTRSSVNNFYPGGISGNYSSGVIIDNNYISQVVDHSQDPGTLLDLRYSRLGGSTITPFFHFTNNVLTRTIPRHAFFLTNPTINVAVPNNTIGECSCMDYRNFLRSLQSILDNYTLNVHQALIENGICLSDRDIYRIGCNNLTPLLSVEVLSTSVPVPVREQNLGVITKTVAETGRITITTAKTPQSKFPLTSLSQLSKSLISPTITAQTQFVPTDRALQHPSTGQVWDQTLGPDASVFPPTLQAPGTEKPLATIRSAQTLTNDINSLDAQSIWNEIYGGVFFLRLRKPFQAAFPGARLSMKFSKEIKPLEFHGGKLTFVSPR
nr:uncharacterized protein LOC123759220 [Procambarus clarkii]